MAVGGEKLDRSISRGIAADHHSRTKAHNSDKSIVLSVNHIAGPATQQSQGYHKDDLSVAFVRGVFSV